MSFFWIRLQGLEKASCHPVWILPESSKRLSTALWWAGIDSLSLFTEKSLFWKPLKVLLSGSNVASLLGTQPQEALWSKCNRDANHNTRLHGKINYGLKTNQSCLKSAKPDSFSLFFFSIILDLCHHLLGEEKLQQLLRWGMQSQNNSNNNYFLVQKIHRFIIPKLK